MTQQRTQAADNGPNMAPPVQVISKTVTRKLGATSDFHAAQVEISSAHLLEAGDHLMNPRQVEATALASYRKGLNDGIKEADAHLRIETGALLDKINAVYAERNELAIAFARLTLLRQEELGRGKGKWAGYGFDDKTGRAVVYVQLPSGHQISWHMDDDNSAMFASTLGAKPLPEFDGQWDGTFIGREENWAVRHIYSSETYSTEETPEGARAHRPSSATHYRTCSGNKRRHYKNAGGSWLYFHEHDQEWHPTDLSDDYLEAHIHRLDCDTQAQASATGALVARLNTGANQFMGVGDRMAALIEEIGASHLGASLIHVVGSLPQKHKPLTRQQAVGYGMVFGLDVVGGDATHVMMPCELHGIPGAIYRVRKGAVEQYVITVKTETVTRYEWRPAAVSAEWVEKHAHPIMESK